MVTIAPDKLRIVPDGKGKPSGILVDIQTWGNIIEALEMADDLPTVKKALVELRAAGGDTMRAGFIPWSKAKTRLKKIHAKKQA